MIPNNLLVAIVGPTGSGKTALASSLGRRFNGVILSADSRQVYRGLDVGTNKEGAVARWHGQPARIIDGVPQLLIDIAEPGQRFTLYDWLQTAREALELVWSHGHLPIVTGGTGLYATALLDGYQPGGGRYAKTTELARFRSLVLMPDVDRTVLYQRSDDRFERIFDELIKEVSHLVEAGVTHKWLQSIGLDYRFASYYLTRQMNRELAITQFQQSSRQYIRRQLTWWRHHNSPRLVTGTADAVDRVTNFISGAEFDTV